MHSTTAIRPSAPRAVRGARLLGLGLVLGAGLAGFADQPAAPPVPATGALAGRFEDVTARLGIVHRNRPPVFDQRLAHIAPLWANFVAGVTAADWNGDDFDDLLFVGSHPEVASQLLRNDGGKGFTDVTAASGLPPLSDAANAATGARFFDYDGDGDRDLYILRLGQNLLFKNDGQGHFTDVTAAAGLLGRHANVLAAIAFDADRDDDLDLVEAGFFGDEVNLFALATTRILPERPTTATNGGRLVFWRNNGDGTFTDATVAAGLADTGFTTALGHADLDDDGFQDFYVANDFGQDRLYLGRGDGTFRDATIERIGREGKKGMNVDFGDVDNNGTLDIYVTNITEPFLKECNLLWLNDGTEGRLIDVSAETGTCDTGWGWAGKFFDFDHDMHQDLYVANGFVSNGEESYSREVAKWNEELRQMAKPEVIDAALWPAVGNRSFAGYERNRLFHNRGDGTFVDVAPALGVDSVADSRGIALLDYDGDGALDLALSNSGQRAQIFRNAVEKRGHWLAVRLHGKGKNGDAIGARVTVLAHGVRQTREVNCGNGYASQSTFVLHFGLGTAQQADAVEVRWSDGTRSRWVDVQGDALVRIEQGSDSGATVPKTATQPRN